MFSGVPFGVFLGVLFGMLASCALFGVLFGVLFGLPHYGLLTNSNINFRSYKNYLIIYY